MDTEPREPAAPPQAPGRAMWRWFRLVGLPVVAILAIAMAILLLRAPSSPSNAVRLEGRDGGAEGADERVAEGKPAPDFALQTTDGQTYRLSELRGRPVMINFWATWCGPCKDEMPAIDEAYQAHREGGFIVLAINVEEPARQVEPYVARLKLTFPVLLDPSGAVAARYRVRSLPTTVFVRPDGMVDGIRVGAYTKRMLLGRIEQFLEQP
jgi:thiol-disulfide isomerase/thioredoxin